MTRLFLPAILLLALLAASITPALASSKPSGALEAAATLYDSGDYDEAYRAYLKLAKDGDHFAQYRVSYMTLNGLGTRASLVDSVAWAVLSAEGDSELLIQYRSAVAALVPTDYRKKATRTAEKFVRRWGEEDESESEWEVMSSRYQRGCTGTKLATNCGRSGSHEAPPIIWGDDKSKDPALRQRIEELNQSIVERAEHAGSSASGS